ncbi:MAG: NUDIX hydrolase [Steroidobacteraceae bacterium]|jgi:8-oxo-dGTP pyrophosphatase MutT (NUDIX family)
MVWRPEVTVAAVIEREDRFLLVEERIRGRRVFNQPAGHLEDGETLVRAVAREVLEETAWGFEPQWLLGIYLWRSRRGRSTLRFAFSGALRELDTTRTLDAPIIATHWLTRAQVLERAARLRTPLVVRCIDDYLAGSRLPLGALTSMVDAATMAAWEPQPPSA